MLKLLPKMLSAPIMLAKLAKIVAIMLEHLNQSSISL